MWCLYVGLFVLGAMVGACIGMLIMALCAVAKDD